jgi:hypothetical protein
MVRATASARPLPTPTPDQTPQGATSNAQVARRATLEERAANATATAEEDARPPFGLIGRMARGCNRRVPLDLTVETAEVYAHPTDESTLVVIAVVRVTNVGFQSTEMFTSLRLVDDRGRQFDYHLVDMVNRSFDLYSLRQKYDAREIREWAQPGLGGRQVWAYLVPSDVRNLRIAPGPSHQCR